MEEILLAIQACDNGELVFNLGNIRSFLYNSKWYPLRAVVNFAKALNNEGELTTDRALVELSFILPYIRIKEIEYNDHFPIAINNNEKLNEIKLLNEIIGGLVNDN